MGPIQKIKDLKDLFLMKSMLRKGRAEIRKQMKEQKLNKQINDIKSKIEDIQQ